MKNETIPSGEFLLQCRLFLASRDRKSRVGDLGIHLSTFFASEPDFDIGSRYVLHPLDSETKVSDLWFVKDGPSWRVSERLNDVRRIAFEGAAVFTGTAYLCTMREMIIGTAAKTYFLKKLGSDIVGVSTETSNTAATSRYYVDGHAGFKTFFFRLKVFVPPPLPRRQRVT